MNNSKNIHDNWSYYKICRSVVSDMLVPECHDSCKKLMADLELKHPEFKNPNYEEMLELEEALK